MNYAVEWTEDALGQLADIWTSNSDRQAVSRAQSTIDRLLFLNPKGNGEHLSEGLYAINVLPLRVQFEISEAERVVTVVSVQALGSVM